MALPDLTQYYQTPELGQAQQEAANAGTTAANYQSAASLLPQKLKDAIMSKLDYNKDIIAEQNKKQAEYFGAPAKAREQYQNIWNPFQRENLVTQARTQAYAPYATLTDILGQRMGNIQDIIGAGKGAFESVVTAAQNAATLARQKYQDLFAIADKLAENAKWGAEYQQKEKQIAKTGIREPDKYPFNELTMGAGVAGALVTPDSTEKLRRYNEYLNEQNRKIVPAPTAENMGTAGYQWNPQTGAWEQGSQGGWLDNIWNFIQGK